MLKKGIITIVLLILSNICMLGAWYGHLKFKDWKLTENWGLLSIILVSWGIALFEYILQVPANKIGYSNNGGPFTLLQLKIIQEAINLVVFGIMIALFFPNEKLTVNHLIGFALLIGAVYFIFKK